jgi:hypothetical protein
MWTCPKCGTKVDPSFDVCWSCGTSPEGVEDPTFVRADESAPIEDPPVELEPTAVDEETLEPVMPPDVELVGAYWAGNHIEAKFLADQLSEQGIPATADIFDRDVEMLSGLPAARVWVRAEDLPRARAWLLEYDRQHKPQIEQGE